jgi:hypothetical protein
VDTDETIIELLRWRLARAEADAPPAPRAARLLELARPWWDTWPERFGELVARLGQMQVAYGLAMTEPRRGRNGGHAVPALIARGGDDEHEASARVLYLGVRGGRLHLRFRLDAGPQPAEPTFEATFVAGDAAHPMLAARATLSVESEYRLDAELPDEVAAEWARLKVTDRMPFRLILRTDASSG